MRFAGTAALRYPFAFGRFIERYTTLDHVMAAIRTVLVLPARFRHSPGTNPFC